MASRPTPYSIALSALIVLHYEGASGDGSSSPLYQEYDNNDNRQQRQQQQRQQQPDARHPRYQVQAFLQEILQQQRTGNWSRTKDHSVSNLIQAFRNHLLLDEDDDTRECVVTTFVEWLRVASSSMDSMMDLMTTLQQSVTHANPVVDATSVSGMYIRSVCCLGFPELSFAETGRLWKQFSKQVQEAMAATATTTTVPPDPRITMGEDDEWFLSSDQMEHLLRQECQRVGEQSVKTDEEDTSSESEENAILGILKHHPELPSAHFLRFLHCLKSKERVGAMDALHAYFDNVLIRRRRKGGGGGGGDGKGNTAEARQLAAEHFAILQFAAILLAALHAETGDVALARLATTEAVRVAQQSVAQADGSSSSSSVAYSLGWLAQTAGVSEPDDAREWMAKCVERAVHETTQNLTFLVAGANLSRVRQTLQPSNRSTSSSHHSALSTPQAAWTYLSAASTTTTVDTAAADYPNDRPLQMTRVPNGDAALRIVSQQRALAAAIWDAFNQPALSGLASLLSLASSHKTNHVATAIQNVARTALYGSKQSILLVQPKKNSIDSDDGDCIYGDALRKMALLRKAFGLALDSSFAQDMALILHEWAVRRGDVSQALGWMRFLLGNLHPGMADHDSVEIDVRLQQSMLLSAQGEWDQAKQLLKQQLEHCRSAGLPLQTAWVLLRLAVVILESSASSRRQGKHSTNFAGTTISALPYLLECLTVCDQNHMDGLHAVAVSILAQVHMQMHRVDAAIAMIEAALPNILQQGHVWFQAEAYLTLAKCHIQQKIDPQNPAMAEQRTNHTRQRKKLHAAYPMAKRALSNSQQLFERCQDGAKLREVYYLQAHVWNALRNAPEREEASRKFLEVSKHLANAATPGDVFDNVLSDDSKLFQMASRGYA